MEEIARGLNPFSVAPDRVAPPGNPTPVQDLAADYFSTRAMIKPWHTPRDIALAYADFGTRARDTGCRVDPGAARTMVAQIALENAYNWMIWYPLIDRCDAPESCVKLRLQEVKHLISGTNSWTLAKTESQAELLDIIEPPRGFARLLTHFKIESYENALARLARIERGIETVEQRRVYAILLASQVSAQIDDIEEPLVGPPGKLEDIGKFMTRLDALAVEIRELRSRLPGIIAISTYVSEQVNDLQNRIDTWLVLWKR